jgi:hypothetical protein
VDGLNMIFVVQDVGIVKVVPKKDVILGDAGGMGAE